MAHRELAAAFIAKVSAAFRRCAQRISYRGSQASYGSSYCVQQVTLPAADAQLLFPYAYTMTF